jgi:hypothetical protein
MLHHWSYYLNFFLPGQAFFCYVYAYPRSSIETDKVRGRLKFWIQPRSYDFEGPRRTNYGDSSRLYQKKI